MIDERTHYVTIRHDTGTEPVWRSPWLTREAAAKTHRAKVEEYARAGWRVRVNTFYRDGTRVE